LSRKIRRRQLRKLRIVSIFIIALFLICACSPLRGPVIDERDDGKILGTLIVSRGKYNVGEMVDVTFTIENISNDPVLLSRDDGLVQDIILSSTLTERRWSEEAGIGFTKLYLEPGETSILEWEIEDLDINIHTFVGFWWSSGIREVNVVVGTEYGSARY
jgi:hypothetical protein